MRPARGVGQVLFLCAPLRGFLEQCRVRRSSFFWASVEVFAMPIAITCSACFAKLKAPDQAAGKSLKCPTCAAAIAVPAAASAGSPAPTAQVQASPASKPMKPCPFCGEDVLAIAKKCKHCGEMLDKVLDKTMLGGEPSPPIQYNCPRCKAPLESPAIEAGTKKPCPECGQRLQVPAAPPPAAPFSSRGDNVPVVVTSTPQRSEMPTIVPVIFNSPATSAGSRSGETRPCPFCDEEVSAIAKKCRHCGETIDVALRAAEDAKRESRRGRRDSGSSAAATVVINNSSGGRMSVPQFGHWHMIHGILTLLTCGMWLPVWLVHYFIWSAKQ